MYAIALGLIAVATWGNASSASAARLQRRHTSDSQKCSFLEAPGVKMPKGRYHARLENVEPRRDMETGDIDGGAKIMPRAKLVRCGMAENFIQMGLHYREIRITD